ncbi:Subtilisin inhibitor-like [Arthrobacter sp. NIO-1057]|nr:Subtilisin inhibitor-like [Arthrobacter sp. NIO-1057]
MGITGSTRRAVTAGGILLLAAVTSSCAAQSSTTTQSTLEITIKADGSNISARYTLECLGAEASQTGTLPNASEACEKLDQRPDLVAPRLDPSTACTEIYGGPQRAEVSGILNGQSIHSEFSRSNGCLISQWNDAEFLFPRGL